MKKQMKKLNAKLENIANTVGNAAHSDPQTNKTTKFDCRGGRLCPPANKQNGITLIALIITIIVMLILVGVTINVALNGELFKNAKYAKEKTEKEIEKERLTEIAISSYNVAEGKITSADDMANKIKNSLGFEKSDKTTTLKLVVQGENTLWQIDLNTSEVREYEEEKVYSFTLNSINGRI